MTFKEPDAKPEKSDIASLQARIGHLEKKMNSDKPAITTILNATLKKNPKIATGQKVIVRTDSGYVEGLLDKYYSETSGRPYRVLTAMGVEYAWDVYLLPRDKK